MFSGVNLDIDEMKKTFLFIVFAAVLSAGCSKVELELTEPERATVTLTAALESEATKTYIDEDKYVCWADGDKVWINGNTYTVNVDNGTATIAGVTAAEHYACVYPSDIVTSFSDGCKVKLSLPSSQTITYDSEDRQVLSLPMAAYGDGTEPLKFKNLCGLMAVTVSNDDKDAGLKPASIKISTSDGPDWTAPLYGTTYSARDLSNSSNIDDSDIGWAILASNLGGSGQNTELDVVISGGPTIAKNGSATYYVTVPVIDSGTRSKIGVEMSGTIGSSNFIFNKKTTSSTKTIGRNQLGTIPIPSTLCYEIKTSGDMNGSGTEADPWQISCKEHWNTMAQDVLDSNVGAEVYYLQICDIDLGSSGDVKPAGAKGLDSSNDAYEKPFLAHYDGGGHTLTVSCPEENGTDALATKTCYGLFPYVKGGTVKNITVKGTYTRTITAEDGDKYVGGIIGFAKNATLSGLTFSGNVTAANGDDVDEVGYFGGVAGAIEGGTVSDLSFDGSFSNYGEQGDGINVGGIAGNCTATSVTNCKATSNSALYIGGNIISAGGLFGTLTAATTVSNCNFSGLLTNYADSPYTSYATNSSTSTGGYYAGGLFGNWTLPYNSQASGLSTTYVSGKGILLTEGSDNKGTAYVGGIAGFMTCNGSLSGAVANKATISLTCYDQSMVGGIAGSLRGLGSHVEMNNSGAVSADAKKSHVYIGGLFGEINRVTGYNISSSYNIGHISATGTDDIYAGGFVGYYVNSNITFPGASSEGPVKASSTDLACAGGLAGYVSMANTEYTEMSGVSIGTSSSSFTIYAESSGGDAYAGGLIGRLYSATNHLGFVDCTNYLEVKACGKENSGKSCAGGLIGHAGNSEQYATLVNKFRNFGAITADLAGYSYAGGLVGFDGDDFSMMEGFWPIALEIFNSENRGTIYAKGGDSASGGGIIGHHDSDGGTYDPCIINCCNRGNISVGGYNGDTYIGGLIGYCCNTHTEIGASFSQCVLSMPLSKTDDVYCGGLSGTEFHINQSGFKNSGSGLQPSYAYPDYNNGAATWNNDAASLANHLSNLTGVPSGTHTLYSPTPTLLRWKNDGGIPALDFN